MAKLSSTEKERRKKARQIGKVMLSGRRKRMGNFLSRLSASLRRKIAWPEVP